MNDLFLAIIIALLAVGLVFYALALGKTEKRVAELEKHCSDIANLQASGMELIAKGFMSQEGVNKTLFELVSAHHIALRMPTGIADEVSNYLNNEGNDNV